MNLPQVLNRLDILMASKVNYRYFYTQGQYFTDKAYREYFYFVNDHGENLKINQTDRFAHEFPFVSICGKERNYVKCSDLPFVFTNLDSVNKTFYLNNTDSFNCSFKPELLYMCEKSGRVYYPLIDNLVKLPTEIGLVKSSIVQELFRADNEQGSLFIKISDHNENYKKMSKLLEKFSLFKQNDQ